MPLFPIEITEMPQFILKSFKTTPNFSEITEMPLFHTKNTRLLDQLSPERSLSFQSLTQ